MAPPEWKDHFFILLIVIYKNVAQSGSAPASGAGGRKFKSCHPDQYLHESDLPGVALSFCSPVPVRFGITFHLTTWVSRNERWCVPGRGISHQQEEYRLNEQLISVHLVDDTDLADISLEISRLEELPGLKILTIWRSGQYSGHGHGRLPLSRLYHRRLAIDPVRLCHHYGLGPMLWPLQP